MEERKYRRSIDGAMVNGWHYAHYLDECADLWQKQGERAHAKKIRLKAKQVRSAWRRGE